MLFYFVHFICKHLLKLLCVSSFLFSIVPLPGFLLIGEFFLAGRFIGDWFCFCLILSWSLLSCFRPCVCSIRKTWQVFLKSSLLFWFKHVLPPILPTTFIFVVSSLCLVFYLSLLIYAVAFIRVWMLVYRLWV